MRLPRKRLLKTGRLTGIVLIALTLANVIQAQVSTVEFGKNRYSIKSSSGSITKHLISIPILKRTAWPWANM